MSTTLHSSTRYFDTIVIGAGISGLACAARLFQHQARHGTVGSIKVLEARDRIGGRIGSVQVNGCRLDTGANWIHGTGTEDEPNPLMKILPHKRYRQLDGAVMFRPPKDNGAGMTGETSRQNNFDESAAKASNAWVDVKESSQPSPSPSKVQSSIIPTEHAAKLWRSMWGLIGSLHEASATLSPPEAKKSTLLASIKDSPAFHSAFKDIDPEYHQTLRGLPQFIENMEAAPLVAQSAEHPEEQAGVGLLEYAIDDFEGDQVFLRDGYVAVVKEVAKELVDGGVMELGVEVEQIHWDQYPIVLDTNVGRFEARNVVCTMPLGVLKEAQKQLARKESSRSGGGEMRKSLFQPELPQEKSTAISSLGFGTLDKIFLVYSYAWWAKEPYATLLGEGSTRRKPTSSEDSKTPPAQQSSRHPTEPDSLMGFTSSLPGISINSDGTVEPGLRTLSVINLHSLTGFSVLSCFVSCANALEIESMSDDEAGKSVHDTLTSWLGHEVPEPEAVHVTRWATDPFSRGSYSNMIAGVSERKHREEFQKPIGNGKGGKGGMLRFAGEHTSSEHFATVHGGLISGWREADGIIGDINGAQLW